MKEMTSSSPIEDISEALAQLPHEDPAFGRAVKIIRVAPGECIIEATDMEQHLYVLMSGYVQMLAISKEGRSLVMSTLGPGSVLGEGAILDLEVLRGMCVQAIDPCVIWQLTSEQARTFTRQHPILGLGMLRTFGRRLAQVENRLEDVAYKRLPERLAQELLRRRDLAGKDEIRVSHQALADSLGTYRETISAILRDFKKENWVELGYRRITLKNPQALIDISHYRSEIV
jgi:CRP-like cAMP-binding protein